MCLRRFDGVRVRFCSNTSMVTEQVSNKFIFDSLLVNFVDFNAFLVFSVERGNISFL